MRYLVTSDEMKAYDNNTINNIGIPGLVLMERAALSVCDYISSIECKKKVLIATGMGNNGGDGLALARLLSEKNYEVEVCCIGDVKKATESFHTQLTILEHYPVKIYDYISFGINVAKEYDLIIDAVFGVGLSRQISGEYYELIQNLNQLKGYKIAIDIPSGVSADNGKVLGCAFRADVTITFGFDKVGLYLYPGTDYCGQIIVRDIGISQNAFMGKVPGIFTYDEAPQMLMPTRRPDGNKGTFGKVLLIAGFENMAGAAVLCSKAILTMGAGMVKVLCAQENRAILQTSVPEAMCSSVEEVQDSLKWADTLVIGPGMGKGEMARRVLEKVLKTAELPLVLDADALNLISESEQLKIALKNYKEPKIMTPHVGELSRLSGRSVTDIKEAFIEVALEQAKEYHSIMVCKDARTFVARENTPSYLNITGNNGMATAGSGDVLAGMIGSLMAQEEDAFNAACKGVYLHALAGDVARDIYTEFGVTAMKIIDNIKSLYK